MTRWGLAVLSADIQDRDGAKILLERVRGTLPRLEEIWADDAYQSLIDWGQLCCSGLLTTILRPTGVKGFVHLP